MRALPRGVRLWSGDVEKQSVPDRARTIRLLPPGTTFEDGAVSPDGRRVLTRNGTIIQLWDAGSGQRVGTPFDARSSINFATFSPDSRRIVVASMDKAARMLDARTGEPLGAPLRHAGSVLRVYSARMESRSSHAARTERLASGKPKPAGLRAKT